MIHKEYNYLNLTEKNTLNWTKSTRNVQEPLKYLLEIIQISENYPHIGSTAIEKSRQAQATD